jgi:SAM-dependent methyltransferase
VSVTNTASQASDSYYVKDFTGYMETVCRLVGGVAPRQTILDVPAGNGLLAARLREEGHLVTCADINREKPDYVFADFNKPLPFADAAFDVVICTEGIEHTLNPAAFVGELCRVARAGGCIVLSTPNLQSAYSRFQFMCCGWFHQFSPSYSRHLGPLELKDRGHISPMGYLQLRYLFQHHGACVRIVAADRWKKKWLIPLLLPFLALGWVWQRRALAKGRTLSDEHCEMLKHLSSPPLLFGRSLIIVFEKA